MALVSQTGSPDQRTSPRISRVHAATVRAISLQEAIKSAILGRMRAREQAANLAQESQAQAAAIRSARLREAFFSDFAAVHAVKQRWGMTSDSLENWCRVWNENPALLNGRVKRSIGWVLEADGDVVGYLGNISLLYQYGGRTLTAVTGHGLVVEPAYRSLTMSLVAAFYRQRDVDLYLTTSAVEAVGKIACAFKSEPLPQADYGSVLFWVLKPYRFANAIAKKLRLPGAVSQATNVLGSMALAAEIGLRARWPRGRSQGLTVREIKVSEIAGEFDQLWSEKLGERSCLLAERSAALLRWHFQIPADQGTVGVLCCYRNSRLLGYLIVRSGLQARNGLQRTIVADMLVKDDNPDVITALCLAAYEHAKRAGSDVLEVMGFPQSIRKVLARWNPYVRKYPACPFYYKGAETALHSALSDGLAWYASPFDGDTSLMP